MTDQTTSQQNVMRLLASLSETGATSTSSTAAPQGARASSSTTAGPSQGITDAADMALSVLNRLRSSLGKGKGKESDRKRARDQALALFTKKKKSSMFWKHKFVCLSKKTQERVPTTEKERNLLIEAGLGEKEVEFENLSSLEQFKDTLLEVYPRLGGGGGFHMLKCLPNSRQLELLPMSLHADPCALRQRVGNARIYLRPIQRDLDTTSIKEESVIDAPFEKCLTCYCAYPLDELPKHAVACEKLLEELKADHSVSMPSSPSSTGSEELPHVHLSPVVEQASPEVEIVGVEQVQVEQVQVEQVLVEQVLMSLPEVESIQVPSPVSAPVQVCNSSVETSGHGDSVASVPGSSSLNEWRELRHEQDMAFQESLRVDELKEQRKQKRAALQQMFAGRDGPVRVAFRLPGGIRTTQTFLRDDVPKVLYQYVFSHHVDGPFVLRTSRRQIIDHASVEMLADLDVDVSTVTVEKTNSGTDPLLFLVPEGTVLPGTVVPGTVVQDTRDAAEILRSAESDRSEFLKKMPAKPTALFHSVYRNNIHSSVIQLFSQRGVDEEFPLRIKFEGERGIDVGGVYRDMLSVFWNDAYHELFDGGRLLTPVLHPQVDLRILPVLGMILSHGYLGGGFLPMRIAFPTLAALLLQTTEVSDRILVATFLETVSTVEANVLTKALRASSEFSGSQQVQLASILGRFGSRQLPTFRGLHQQLLQAARFEFLTKPSATLKSISSGIPECHRSFWSVMSVGSLYSTYLALSASPAKVLEQLEEPDLKDVNQDRVLGYVRQYIGSMTHEEVQLFLHFVTSSPVCTSRGVRVTFNSTTGAGRRPIAHTCSGILELSSFYQTYEDFRSEFRAVLYGGEGAWKMDAL